MVKAPALLDEEGVVPDEIVSERRGIGPGGHKSHEQRNRTPTLGDPWPIRQCRVLTHVVRFSRRQIRPKRRF
jgi:hypothetical protein